MLTKRWRHCCANLIIFLRSNNVSDIINKHETKMKSYANIIMSKYKSSKTLKGSSKKINAKAARNQKLFHFSYSPAIVKIQENIILETFEIVFEQFPAQIDKLKTILKNTDPKDKEIVSDVNKLFQEPPSLNDIKKKQDEQKLSTETGHCNLNAQEAVHLSYDGLIEVNSRLLKLAEEVSSFADFYVDWQKTFDLAMALLRPRLNEEVHLVIEIRDALTECVSNMLSSVEGNHYDL